MNSFELDIEVLWHTDDTRVLADSGVEFNVDELERKTITFYNIDCISPYKWDDVHIFCKISVGGEYWIAAYEYEDVKEMIAKAMEKSSINRYVELYKGLETLFKQYSNGNKNNHI